MRLNNFGLLFLLALSSTAFSADYSSWSKYRTVTVNTTTAGVTGAVTNYPLLVRLTNADSAHGSNVLAGALPGGADVRFADSAGTTALPYQIEQWSATSAAIWVLVPSIAGSATTNIRLYWGKTGAADSSNGSRVFSPGNGFMAVWHLNDSLDATGSNPVLTSTALPSTNTNAAIGAGKTFDGSSQFLQITGSTPSTLSLGTDHGPYTLTAWVNPSACNSGARMTVLAKYPSSGSATARQFIMSTAPSGGTSAKWRMSNAPTSITATSNNEYAADVTCAIGTWQYLALTYSLPGTPTGDATGAANLNGYSNNDAVVNGIIVSNSNVNDTTSIFTIGSTSNLTGRFMNGSLDEITVSNVQRSPDWINLNYQTQNASQTAVTLGATILNISVPGAPTGVVGSPGNGQAVVIWTIPTSNGGSPITGYKVTAVQDTSKHCSATGPTAVTCTVTGLTNGTAYSFTVTAANAAGTGPASTASALVTPTAPASAPSPPTSISAVAGNGRATVTFGNGTANGSAITGYIVTSNPDGKTCSTTGATGSSCVDSVLTNGVAYTFTVVATSAAGNSLASISSNTVTPFGPPAAPTGVTAVAGAAQAVVSWTAPASNGGSAITGYTVKGVSDSTKTCTPSPATATTCTVTGLTAGSWSFRVRAVNAAGAGNGGISNTITGILGFAAMNGFGVHMTGSSVVFRLPSDLASEARVSVMDVWGRTVWSQTVGAGINELSWNGKSAGNIAARGIYFVRLTTETGGKSRVLAESKIPMLP